MTEMSIMKVKAGVLPMDLDDTVSKSLAKVSPYSAAEIASCIAWTKSVDVTILAIEYAMCHAIGLFHASHMVQEKS